MGQVMLGNAANLYRVWLVWERNFRPILIPGALFFVSGACAWVVLGVSAELQKQQDMSPGSLKATLIAFVGIALFQPLLTSGLIIIRLAATERRDSQPRYQARGHARALLSFSPINRIIVQSTVVYMGALLVVTALWWTGRTSFDMFGNVVVPIVPLVGTFPLLMKVS
ncbi:hypothetical protein CALCODRAFT_74057 [Calocera cornea HHB12733]|uniref:Uncharacterized protein n=1 Tax=Calocera cornea HHB12733 TaxID=1353952 RepID=A0A165DI32_9BASI|nr:hypothetical protein CALCODRAFT_74057 [Calocera cornea HHB12733]